MDANRGSLGKIGHILIMAGSAVGLGNIWKFPNLAGQNGGGIFLLFYIFFLVVMGFPLVLAEHTIGRYAGVGPNHAYRKIALESGCGQKQAGFWSAIGSIGAILNFLILSFYVVIAGWVLLYCCKVFTTPINTMDMDMFGAATANPLTAVICALVIVLITVFVDMWGLNDGIERMAKILMPALIVMLIVCAVCTLTLPGAIEGIKYFFIPDPERVESAGGYGHIALVAMGQCFFSLSLGTCMGVTVGSFMKRDSNLQTQTLSVAGIDFGVAILAAVAILPVVFSMASITGIDPSSQTGPGMLMFAIPQSLYAAFGSTAGSILTFVMFLLVLFATITSTCAMMLVPITWLKENKDFSTKKAAITTGIALAILATVNALSNTDVLGSIQIAGMNIQDTIDYVVNNYFAPIAEILMCLFIGYVWKPQNAINEISNNGSQKFFWSGIFTWLIKLIIPLIILLVFLSSIGIL